MVTSITARSSIKTLLIEDNLNYANLVKTILSKVTDILFTVQICDTLAGGIDYLITNNVDLILLDLHLPDSSGIETFIGIKEYVGEIPIIVLSGNEDESAALEAVQLGAQDFLVKSDINRSMLVRSLRYAIERHSMQSKLLSLSLTDELTGLNNRRGFLMLAGEELKLAKRMDKNCIVTFLDLDGLKEINDSFGHIQGDAAIVSTAGILSNTFRECDIIARLGGDEFAVFSVGATTENSECILARLQSNLDNFNNDEDVEYLLSLSIGVACFNPHEPVTIEDLLSQADSFMYLNKKSKRVQSALSS